MVSLTVGSRRHGAKKRKEKERLQKEQDGREVVVFDDRKIMDLLCQSSFARTWMKVVRVSEGKWTARAPVGSKFRPAEISNHIAGQADRHKQELSQTQTCVMW